MQRFGLSCVCIKKVPLSGVTKNKEYPTGPIFYKTLGHFRLRMGKLKINLFSFSFQLDFHLLPYVFRHYSQVNFLGKCYRFSTIFWLVLIVLIEFLKKSWKVCLFSFFFYSCLLWHVLLLIDCLSLFTLWSSRFCKQFSTWDFSFVLDRFFIRILK